MSKELCSFDTRIRQKRQNLEHLFINLNYLLITQVQNTFAIMHLRRYLIPNAYWAKRNYVVIYLFSNVDTGCDGYQPYYDYNWIVG